VVFPAWLAGDWACAAELFKADAGPGELVLASAVPGAQVALVAARSAVGAGSAIRRERRQWHLEAGGALEVPRDAPASLVAAAMALAGPNATVRPLGQQGEDRRRWDAIAPSGLQWELRLAGAVGELDTGKEKFRASEFFQAEALVAPGGLAGSSAIRVDTVFRRVPAGSSPTGGLFKIGLGTVDPTRPFIVQAIQTATIFPPPPGPGRKSSDIALATYKTRLLLSPIVVEPL